MAPNPRRLDAKLAELYARVPNMKDCKGLCSDSCGPIEASVRERQKIEKRAGKKLEACPVDCSMLTPLGRCSVYEDRPMICRLWGTVPSMACEYGCEPERWLTEDESYQLLIDSMIVGGPPPGMTIDSLRRIISSPALLQQVSEIALAIQAAKNIQKGLTE